MFDLETIKERSSLEIAQNLRTLEARSKNDVLIKKSVRHVV